MDKKSFLKQHIQMAMLLVIVILAIIVLFKPPKRVMQATDPIFPILEFQGEYKIGEGEWLPIEKNTHISSTKGPVTLNGQFIMLDPETYEPLGAVPSETKIAVYLNHLNMSFLMDNQILYQSDIEYRAFGSVNCGQIWNIFIATQTEEVIEIVLTNHHKYGNENAVDDFLDSCCIYEGGIFERQYVEKGEMQRIIGIAIVLSAVAILGSALFVFKIHIKTSYEIGTIGAIILFAGIYYIFSSENICLWYSNYRFNTSILCLCKELYIFFITMLILKILSPKTRKAGSILVGISFCVMIALFLASMTERVLLYDTWFQWEIVELFICIGLLICLVVEYGNLNKANVLVYGVNIFVLLSYIVDFIAIYFGWWKNTLLSMMFFAIMFIGAIILVLKVIPQNIQAIEKNKELEFEQKLLQAQLNESRIAVMMSQIQPHFIYNSLAVIQELCYEEPQKAEQAIGTLAEFLKGNMAISLSDKVVSFQDELNHTKKYLEIEHLRFEDQLVIIYDIQVDEFCIPALTLQPIVENAVRHGVRKKEEGGTIKISSREDEIYYEVLVEDDGPGFSNSPETNKEGFHIGIKNVRERLARMCNGTLEIISEEGKGTCVRIRIEKEFLIC